MTIETKRRVAKGLQLGLVVGVLVGLSGLIQTAWLADPIPALAQTVTVDSTQSPLVVNAVADLADLTPTDGQSVIIKTGAEKGLWYYDKDSATATGVSVLNGPGSVGRFLVINNDAGSVAAATAITAAEITDDGLLELQAFDGSTAKSLTLEELKKTGVQVVNVLQYGATGNGVADDTAEIQLAIDAANSGGGGVVYLPHGTYLISDTLTLPSSVLIMGAADVLLTAVSSEQITIAGTVDDSSVLYQDHSKYDNQVYVTTKAMFSVGDWVIVKDSPESDENSAKGIPQQLLRVVAVDASNGSYDVLTVDDSLRYDYTVTGSTTAPLCAQVTPVEKSGIVGISTHNIKIDLSIASNVTVDISAATGDTPLISMTSQGTVAVRDITFRARCSHTYQGSGGLPQVSCHFVGISRGTFDVSAVGGYENGIRLYGCSAIKDLTAISDSPGVRGVYLYRCNGRASLLSVANSPSRTAEANFEAILLDHCTDLHIAKVSSLNQAEGDGLELRVEAKNITIDHVHLDCNAASPTEYGLNIHCNVLENVTINHVDITGFLIGCDIRDNFERLAINGGSIRPATGQTSYTPFRVGRGERTQDGYDLTARSLSLTHAGSSPAINITDADGLGFLCKRITIEDCWIYGSTFGNPVLSISRTRDLTLRNIICPDAFYNSAGNVDVDNQGMVLDRVGLMTINLGSSSVRYMKAGHVLNSERLLTTAGRRVFVDTFTDTAETAIGSHTPDFGALTWVDSGAAAVIRTSNKADPVTAGKSITVNTGLVNCGVDAFFIPTTSAAVFDVVARYTDDSNYVGARFSTLTGNCTIVNVVAAAETVIGSITPDNTAADATARKALTSLVVGESVYQTDATSLYRFIGPEGDEDQDAAWEYWFDIEATATSAYAIGLEVEGTSARMYLDGNCILVGEITGNTTATKQGIRRISGTSGGAARCDSFSIGAACLAPF